MPDFKRVHPAIRFGLLVLCVITFAARLFTLTADFPAGIDWSASQYSDEGWYAGGAINEYITGSWYTPGDLNTAINFPALQILESGYYRVFGLSLASARSLTVIFTALLLLLSYLITRKSAGEVPALICAGLLACNFYLFGFSKFAILEIPMVTLVLLAIWWVVRSSKVNLWRAIVLALIFSLALLTKANALFGLPVLLLAIWQKPDRGRSKTWASLVFLACVAFLYGGYILWVLQHYRSDYLSYNEYSLAPRITWTLYYFIYTAGRVIWNGRVIDPVMYFLSVFLVPFGLFLFRRYRRNSLVQLSLVWLATQSIILITRGYLPPRYYLLFIAPLTILFSILMTMGIKDLQPLFFRQIGPKLSKITAHLKNRSPVYLRALPVVLLSAIALFNLIKMADYLRVPNFTVY